MRPGATVDARPPSVAKEHETGTDRLSPLVRRVVLIALLAQLLAMGAWSTVLYQRYSLTNDAGQYLQGFYLISHGHLAAHDTVLGEALLRDHFTLAWWPMSVLDLIWPHDLWYLWLQDAAMVAAELVAFIWIFRVVSRRRDRLSRGWAAALIGLGGLLLIANPWTYWATSWDIHLETYACPFILLAALDFSEGRTRRAWLWVAIVISFGDVTATWIIGLAVSALLAAVWGRGRHLVRTAGLLLGAVVAWLLAGSLLGGTSNVLDLAYGYLASTPAGLQVTHLNAFDLLRDLLLHPLRTASVFWSHILNVLADVGPSGYLGIFTPWTFGVPAMILLENNLISPNSQLFSWPSFQSSPVFIFSSVGIIIILVAVVTRAVPVAPVIPARSMGSEPQGTRRDGLEVLRSEPPRLSPVTPLRRWAAHRSEGLRRALWSTTSARVVIAIVALNALLWALVWIPPLPSNWLLVTPGQAAVLQHANRQIPTNDEVVVSQGVVGRFSQRPKVYDLVQNTNIIPVSGHTVWFVVLPNAGIEDQDVDAAMGTVDQMVGTLGATLVEHAHGVWVLRWHRATQIHKLVFPAYPSSIGAWITPGPAGASQLVGQPRSWHVSATGSRGYVVSGDYWRRSPGLYRFGIELSSASPVSFEIWNTNSNTLVERSMIPPTNGLVHFSLPVTVRRLAPPRSASAGWGPFRIKPVTAPPGQTMEIRVWTAAGGSATIYRLWFYPQIVSP
jgi:hypothetical protein